MNIGTVAEKSGVPPKTIRYYESIGLIPSADRRANGYRTYSEIDMYTLNFIKRARSLGFSVDEVRDLLDLWRDKRRSSAKVKALTRSEERRVGKEWVRSVNFGGRRIIKKKKKNNNNKRGHRQK